MDYKEALKLVRTKKERESYLIIEMGYDNKMILPHKEGIILLSTLINAEHMSDPYNKPIAIREFDREKLRVTQMSAVEYERIKICTLLGITMDEVKQAESPQPETPQ
jgi:hypothetical protein